MVVILQLCIFLAVAIMRGRFLFGTHLSPFDPDGKTLCYEYRVSEAALVRHIGIPQPGGIPFVIRRRRWYHRLLKGLGIATEVGAMSPSFDGRFVIVTDFPGRLERLLASPGLKDSLQALFGLAVKSLHATPHRMWCVIGEGERSKPFDHFQPHLALLRQMSAATQASSADGQELRGRWSLGGAAAIVIAIHAGLLTLGIFGWAATYADSIQTAERGALLALGGFMGAAACWVWFLCLLAAFAGSSWSSWVIADFLVCGVPGIILSGMLVVRESNIHLPQPQATVHELPIIQKACTLECSRISSGFKTMSLSMARSYQFASEAECSLQGRERILSSKKLSDTLCLSRADFAFTLRLKHWRQQEPYSLSAEVQVFDAVRTGDMVGIPVHPGALGIEWVDPDRIAVK